MARTRPEKEATLREVLAEVSLLDVARPLKYTFAYLGCLGVFGIIAVLIGSATSVGTGSGLTGLGIPAWAFWLAIVWFWLWSLTKERSYHEMQAGWYFPKLGWFSSLALAAYFVGLVLLIIRLANMEQGFERVVTASVIYLGYLGPFIVFLWAINIGHKKLMERRAAAQKSDESIARSEAVEQAGAK